MLHNHIQSRWSFYNFVKLNDVGMTNNFQDVYFSCNTLYVINLSDFIFFKDFDSYFLVSKQVDTLLNFSKGSLT
jgi:hypothetical protein